MAISFSRPQEYVITTTQDVCLFLAGVGSGKTYIIGFQSGYFIQNFPKVPGFIGANTYMQLSQSTLFRVFSVWEEMFGWKEDRDYVVDKQPPKSWGLGKLKFKSHKSVITFKSGAVVFVGSLDNAKAHDGKEFGWAFLDETKDSREDDVKDVILARLRSVGMYISSDYQLTHQNADMDTLEANRSFNPLYILTSPAKVGWINEWFKLDEYQEEIQSLIYNKEDFFIKEYDDKCVVISSTYHNEENLPKGYIEKQIANRTEEKAKMLIYGNPFVRSGGEFYSSFSRMEHVKDVSYKPHLPIHISFDQNVVPYITATLYQIETVGAKRIITQFDEICLANPRNTTSKLCLEFIKRWGAKCDNGLYFYGDPSGRKSDTRSNEHDYKIVEKMLRKYLNNRSNRVPYVHPRVLKRKDFANDCFAGGYDIEIIIGKNCKKSIADFEFVKEDENGKKSKHKVKDKITGLRYEKYGHTSDSFDYFLCEAFKPLFKKYYK